MILFQIGFLILVGLLFGKLAKLVKLPNVTGYLVGGLLVGPSVLGLTGLNIVTDEALSYLKYFSEVALGFIAFTIGTQFQFSYFKKIGKGPIIIAIFESLVAVLFVFLGMVFILREDVSFSLVLSAIAAATAPAATLMVIKQYKAKGPVTSNLISVVAIDDAVALTIFGIMVAIANSIKGTSSNILLTILNPLIEVVLSLLIGFVVGIILCFLLRLFKGRGNRISATCAVILIVVSTQYLVKSYSLSTLLACMMMGAVFTNVCKKEDRNQLVELIDRFNPPILILFFVISGANLKLSALPSIGLVGLIYILFRVLGKSAGAYIGATISKSEPTVKKWLGLALVPQAGVAIGLSLTAGRVCPEYADKITAVVLSATLIYELIGPLLTKIALIKSNEIIMSEAEPKSNNI